MEQLGGLIISVVAVIVALIALLYSRVSARRARTAAASAEQAAESAHSDRLRTRPDGWVEMGSPQTDAVVEPAVAAVAVVDPPTESVEPWRLSWESGSDYRLTNTSGSIAREIEIATRDDGPRLPDHDCGDLEPGDVVAFSAAGYVGMADNRVTVTWYGPDTSLHVWRAELPGAVARKAS
jgi:hypothetical protein